MNELEKENEKPPPVCNPASGGVRPVVGNGCTSWLRKVGSVWGISSPMLGARLRNDMAILETHGGK